MTTPVETAAFTYGLPPDLIAQHPLPDRGTSRLLVLNRSANTVAHRYFPDLVDLLAPGDVLVVNTSKVMRARLHGRRKSGAPAELLLLRAEDDKTWLALGHPGGKLKPGRTVEFGPEASVEILDVLGGGLRRIRWTGALSAWEVMDRYGSVPLPPYITRTPQQDDESRYQTVFAKRLGSAAAPTAGLHFTQEMLDTLKGHGVVIATVDLAIGAGTFKPVTAADLREHKMHTESYVVPEATAHAISKAHRAGHACWAVGTTVVRTLESAARADGTVRPGGGETDLFIHPPYAFRVVDKLITNFHLPRSTLLMLVAAFGGYDAVMRAYASAVEARYRLYSYGDAMAVV